MLLPSTVNRIPYTEFGDSSNVVRGNPLGVNPSGTPPLAGPADPLGVNPSGTSPLAGSAAWNLDGLGGFEIPKWLVVLHSG